MRVPAELQVLEYLYQFFLSAHQIETNRDQLFPYPLPFSFPQIAPKLALTHAGSRAFVPLPQALCLPASMTDFDHEEDLARGVHVGCQGIYCEEW